jgi:LytS/YehU family sensor histidine kinase
MTGLGHYGRIRGDLPHFSNLRQACHTIAPPDQPTIRPLRQILGLTWPCSAVKERQAEETLARLSDLLRCVLEDVEAQEVPLQRELDYLELYLSIEKVRFQDRLRVDISVSPAVLNAAFPHMGLQPIVENAIRHGLGRSSAAGRIQISASRVDDRLEVKVQDDGPGPPANSPATWGIGLTNTRARLTQLYGDAGQLIIANGEQGGAVVTMMLPYRLAPGISETEMLEVHAFDNSAG